ncbi:hypothetical protein F4781DRAFT_19473 [Annulohypoxylon bovei var. microspora]|nr:hypothetical protein F4781DRAFT_19473 [Annulohypoxylon bovei var. microspora]
MDVLQKGSMDIPAATMDIPAATMDIPAATMVIPAATMDILPSKVATRPMKIMVPEILGIVCSNLEIEDVRRFRLCCRAFANAGACYVHNKVVIYFHETDFEMLRQISSDPIAARNVQSLVYFGENYGPIKHSMEQFRRLHDRYWEITSATSKDEGKPLPPRLGDQQMLELYSKYGHAFDREQSIIRNNEDISCIREVISKFTALREVKVSKSWNLGDARGKSPFRGCIVPLSSSEKPDGRGMLESVLDAVFEKKIKLKKLTAGKISWRWFQKPSAEMSRTIFYLSELTCLDLCIATGMIGDRGGARIRLDAEIPKCRSVIKTGILRRIIKSLTRLKALSVTFDSYSDKHGFAASLEDVIEPNHTWEHLDSLRLESVACSRSGLVSIFKRHRRTLKSLCLMDICLGRTSWEGLLIQTRRTLDLRHACICGELFGFREFPPLRREYWNVGIPGEFDGAYPTRDDINDYLLDKESTEPCPLNRHSVFY